MARHLHKTFLSIRKPLFFLLLIFLGMIYISAFANAAGQTKEKDSKSKGVPYDTLSIEGIRTEMVYLASRIQDYEARAMDIESALQEVSTSIQEKETQILSQYDLIKSMVGSLVHLSQTSPLLLTLTQNNPNDVVKAGILLKSLLPQLKEKGNVLQQQLAELQRMQNNMSGQRTALDVTRAEILQKQVALGQLYELKAKSMKKQPKIQLEASALQAHSVHELAAQMSQNKQLKRLREAHMGKERAGKVAGTTPVALLNLQPPVHGKVLTTFDHSRKYTPFGRGVVIQTRVHAQVVSPVSGTVFFSGPFRGYGNILILGSGEDHHIILAGLENIHVAVGQDVIVGEPVGEVADADGTPKLYLELRKKTETIDPTPWVIRWNQ